MLLVISMILLFINLKKIVKQNRQRRFAEDLVVHFEVPPKEQKKTPFVSARIKEKVNPLEDTLCKDQLPRYTGTIPKIIKPRQYKGGNHEKMDNNVTFSSTVLNKHSRRTASADSSKQIERIVNKVPKSSIATNTVNDVSNNATIKFNRIKFK